VPGQYSDAQFLRIECWTYGCLVSDQHSCTTGAGVSWAPPRHRVRL
jgi:hypothetical protein